MVRIIAAVVLLITLYICAAVTNKKEKREEELTFAYPHLDTASLNVRQSVYVPVNTDRYLKKGLGGNLTTVLKIRNTSFSDSLYVFKVHYFDREGRTLKKFVDWPLLIKPMATTEIVVKNTDFDRAGDNFIVEWRANNPKHFPLIQAISTEPGNAFIIKENGIILNTGQSEKTTPDY